MRRRESGGWQRLIGRKKTIRRAESRRRSLGGGGLMAFRGPAASAKRLSALADALIPMPAASTGERRHARHAADDATKCLAEAVNRVDPSFGVDLQAFQDRLH